MNIAIEKKSLRTEFHMKRDSLTETFRSSADIEICRELRGMEELAAVPHIASFSPVHAEPDLSEFVLSMKQAGKKVFFPRFNGDIAMYEMAEAADFPGGFIKGRFGIPEPTGSARTAKREEIEEMTWLVPGLSYDRSGARLGHGNGVYDRLLDGGSGLKIGICYNVQLANNIPFGTHDVPVDFIVTEKGIIKCNKGGS